MDKDCLKSICLWIIAVKVLINFLNLEVVPPNNKLLLIICKYNSKYSKNKIFNKVNKSNNN